MRSDTFSLRRTLYQRGVIALDYLYDGKMKQRPIYYKVNIQSETYALILLT